MRVPAGRVGIAAAIRSQSTTMYGLPPRERWSWFWLVQAAGVVELVLLLGIGGLLKDREALAFAVVVAISLAWVRFGGGRLPVIVRGLIFADVAFFMIPAAALNIGQKQSLAASIPPLLLGTTSATGLLAAVAFVAVGGDRYRGGAAPKVIAVVAGVAVLAGAGFALATAGAGSVVAGSHVSISATNARFSDSSLSTTRGNVTVEMTNNDLFWHTFTSDSLGVNLQVPVKGSRSVTFQASPGTYEYHCAIPGHAAIGMKGTLEVR